MQLGKSHPWQHPFGLLRLALLVAVCCWISITLTRGEGRIAAIWLANGFVLAVLLAAPTRDWPRLLGAAFVGNLAANLILSDAPGLAVLLAACNSFEILLAAWPLRRRFGEALDLSTAPGLLYFSTFCLLLAPLLAGLLASLILAWQGIGTMAAVFSAWFPSDAMGLLIVTPLVLALQRDVQADGHMLRWRDLLLPWLLMASASLLVFTQTHYPLLFLAFPPLLVLTYMQGLRGTVLGMLTLTLIAVTATLYGSGPFMLIASDSMHTRILVLQMFIATAAVQGLVVGMLLAERQRLTTALQRSELSLRTIANSLPALIAHIDKDQRYCFVNAHISTVFGVDAAAMLGRTMREVRGEMIYADLAPHIASALAGKAAHFESHGLAQGRQYHYQSNYIPDLAADGRVEGFFAMTFDITDRKNAELRQAADEERLRVITDNLPALISYFDPKGIYRFCNQTHANWFGKPVSEWIGSDYRTVIDEPFAMAQAPYIEQALKGQRVDAELSLHINGSLRTLAASYVPHLSSDGRVLGVYKLMSDISSLMAVQAQLHRLSRYDVLTGLANRREFQERLEMTIARNRRMAGNHALMFLDIDHFKGINDSHGHAAGDAVLREVAVRMQASVRHTDTVARLAGDEFVVILDGLHTSEESQFIARKIIAAMDKTMSLSDGPIKVGISIGIAYDASATLGPDDLLARADAALYEAKAAGRNTYRLTDSRSPGLQLKTVAASVANG